MKNLTYTYALVLMAILFSGCYQSGNEKKGIPEKGVGNFDPYEELTAEKIDSFKKIMESFPEGKLPAFDFPKVKPVSTRLSPENYASQFRENLKTQIDPELFVESWKGNSTLRGIVNKQGLSVGEFSALVIQVSLAYTSESLGTRMNLLQNWKDNEKLVDEQLAVLKELNDAKVPVTSPETQAKRDSSLRKLEYALAICYFCELLYHVPQESRQAIKPALQELKQFLPDPESTIPRLTP